MPSYSAPVTTIMAFFIFSYVRFDRAVGILSRERSRGGTAGSFPELITDAVPQGRWVPRFEHLLIDQTKQGADSVSGAVGARLAPVAMMATVRESRERLLEQATRLMAELYRAAGLKRWRSTWSTCWRPGHASTGRRLWRRCAETCRAAGET